MPASSRAPLAALAIALVLAACGGDEDPTVETPATSATTPAAAPAGGAGAQTSSTAPSGTLVTLTVRGGSVEGPSRVRVDLSAPVRLQVTSDTADEVHVHGYEKRAEVGPGKVAELSFTANIPGTFEVELEEAHRRISTLEVQP